MVVIPVGNAKTGKWSVESAPFKPTQEPESSKEPGPSQNESLVETPSNEKSAEADQQHDNHVDDDAAAPQANTTEIPLTLISRTKYPSPFVPATDLLPVQPEPQAGVSPVDNGRQQAKEPQNGPSEVNQTADTSIDSVPLGEESALQGDPMEVDTPPANKTPQYDATRNPAETQTANPATPPEERPSDNSIIVVESSDSENQVAPPSAQRQTRRPSIQGPQPKVVLESPAKTRTEKSPAKSTPAKSSPAKHRPSIQGVEVVNLTSQNQTEEPASIGPGPGQMGLGITRSPPKPKRQTAKRQGVSMAEMYRRTNGKTPSPPQSPMAANGSPKASKRGNHVDTMDVDSETSAAESEAELGSRIEVSEAEGKPIRVVRQMEEVLGMMKQLRSAKKENNKALVLKLERQLKARKLALEGQPKNTEKSNSEPGILSTAPNPAPGSQSRPSTTGHATDVASSPPRPALLPSPVVDTRPMVSPGSGKPLRAEVPLVRGKKLFKNTSQPSQRAQGTQKESAADKDPQKNENDKESTPEYSSSSSEASTQSEAESDRVSKEKQTRPASASEFDSDDESAFENMSTPPQASKSKTTTKTKPTDNAVASSSESSDNSQSDRSNDSGSDESSKEDYQSAASKEASVESEVSASEQPTSTSTATIPPPKTKTNGKTDVDNDSSSSSDSADSDDSDAESAGGDIPFIPRSKKTQSQSVSQSPRVTAAAPPATATATATATRGRTRHGLGRARTAAISGTNDTKAHPASSPFAQREKTELVTFSQPAPANRRQSSVVSDATRGRRTRTTLKALKDQMRQA